MSEPKILRLVINIHIFKEGGGIKKVLSKLDSLELILPAEFRPFLVFFRAFKKVRDGSFTSGEYDVNTPAYIVETLVAAKNLEQFGINLLPKWHLLLHVPDFCVSVGAPLGKFGDQGVEQVHQLYEKVWTRFRVNDTENEGFKAKQLISLLAYNSDQLYRLVVDKERRGRKKRAEENRRGKKRRAEENRRGQKSRAEE